jgi:YebC/PmpR family DNA-binding regulatory protein
MSGHSHWAKIKRSKASTDARRGRLWSKLARKVIVAAKTGGGNPDENLNLRYAIDEAKAANMPNDTIERAIKKGAGELGGASFEPVVYEGYGPGGVAFMVECLTDNRNRTAAEMRKLFERGGGQLGAANCVAWMFRPKGTFAISVEAADEDRLVEVAVEASADDVQRDGEVFEITCELGAFAGVRQALADRQIETVSAERGMVPDTRVAVQGAQARQVLKLMDALADSDDVQNVYANFDIPEEVMAAAESES